MDGQTRLIKAEKTCKEPPKRSRNVFTDIKYFLLDSPAANTFINFGNGEEKRIYTESILQRIDIDVDKYKIFNIHRIGIEAPPSYVFDELLKWSGDSSCWPNNIAKVYLQDKSLEKIRIYLFGRIKSLLGLKNGIFGFKFLHLFDLTAIRIHGTPASADVDNARYLLYECKGGYPIGVFCMYVRSPILERGEKEMSQLFMMVGFDFFGSKTLSKMKFIRRIWESFHNRVTGNVGKRFKQLCEWQFDKFTNGT
ncbi:MAG TPA: hypothetical protein QF480_00065 [Bacteroidales bacterium]|jgi:hypothetical protein|nr:hypothetical protein [Bacteroidales bacterium]|tara:strand:- start:742 stop:1497 length:756 start_codon:yes stop_codon:yes gene_type:complete